MSKVIIEADFDGYRKLRSSPEVVDFMQKLADKALSQLGDGYSSAVHYYEGGGNIPGKAVINVYAESREAKRENLDNNTILKAVFGSG